MTTQVGGKVGNGVEAKVETVKGRVKGRKCIKQIPIQLGQVFITPGANLALLESRQTFLDFISRHMIGDWGELCETDWEMNNKAVQTGGSIYSSYYTANQQELFVITEWDRSCTTILLPEER